MAKLRVEVVYALPEGQAVIPLQLAEGSSAGAAVAASGLAKRHGLAETSWILGIGGRRVAPDQVLRDGDRVEILRPLAVDPKEARRKRARKARRA
jgi:putative ubiquitin-RnfH superfamily antitoxin RatB of RatAB toxin-antitoxin module